MKRFWCWLTAEGQRLREDAERWRAGVRLKQFPQLCSHDDSMQNGYSWYVDLNQENEGYETAEQAMDAALHAGGEKG